MNAFPNLNDMPDIMGYGQRPRGFAALFLALSRLGFPGGAGLGYPMAAAGPTATMGPTFAPYGQELMMPYGQQMLPYGQQMLPYGQQMMPYGQQMLPYGQQMLPYGQQMLTSGQQMLPYGQQMLPYGQQMGLGAGGLDQSQYMAALQAQAAAGMAGAV